MSTQNIESSATLESSTIPYGWNYGLTDPVITSPFPDEANYFSNAGTVEGESHWVVAVESEQAMGVSDPGPTDQSFPITNLSQNPTANPGPVALDVAPDPTPGNPSGFSVDLETDFYNYAQPAGAGFFTWYAFGENVDLGGGPLPPPDLATCSVNLLYNAWLPDAGARASVTYQGWWNNQSFEIEMDLNRQTDNWGANSGALVQNLHVLPGVTDVELNGAALGLFLIPGVATNVTIDWGNILQTLINDGVIAAPVGGWSNSASQAFYVTTEFYNQAQSGSGSASLQANSFEISSSSAGVPTATTQIGGDTMFSVTPGSSGTQVTDSITGEVVQTLPSVATDTMQFVSIDGFTYGTNLASAETLGLDPTQLLDYNGNALGGVGQWYMLGAASVQPGAAPSYILIDPTTGRWAEVGLQPNGTINFQDNGDNGNTRVVGIYQDPLVAAGIVAPNSPDDSQTRFLADVQADRLDLLGSVYDQENGGMDLMFQLTNSSDVYLRAILFPDGNIQYANYVTGAQLTSWATSQEISPTVYDAWLSGH
jgi:hypothetical protein